MHVSKTWRAQWRQVSRPQQMSLRGKRRNRGRANSAQLELAFTFKGPKVSTVAGASRPEHSRASHESVMDDEIVLMREVVRRTKRHRSTIYRWMERDEFPAQLRTKCGRAIGWSRIAFESWMRSPAGVSLLATSHE